jgi:hypothetical protein
MTANRDLNYGDALPEMFVDQIQEFIGTYASPNFRVVQSSATALQIVASAGNGQVCAAVGGKWRYITTTISAADPGGTAGIHTLWLTTGANSYLPGPPESDTTNYTFGLEIRASGTPSAAFSRQIGTVEWDGTSITRVLLDVGTPPPDQTLGTASSVSMQSRVSGDTTYRFVRQADGKLLWGPGGVSALDTDLYRGAVDSLRTDDNFGVRGDVAAAARFIDLYEPAATAGSVRVLQGADTQPRLRLGVSAAGAGLVEAGPGGASSPDTNLYRHAPDTWGTDDNFRVRGDGAGAARFLEVVSPNATTRATTRVFVTGDTVPRAEVGVNAGGEGFVAFGPGGGAGVDAAITRTGAGVMALSGSLQGNAISAATSLTAPTVASTDVSGNVATTAFVSNFMAAQGSVEYPQAVATTAAVGVSGRWARADHRHANDPGIYDPAAAASRLNPMTVFTWADFGLMVDAQVNGKEMYAEPGYTWLPNGSNVANFPAPRSSWAAIGGTLQWRWYLWIGIVGTAPTALTVSLRFQSWSLGGVIGAITAVVGATGLQAAGGHSLDSGWATMPAFPDGMIVPMLRFDKTGSDFTINHTILTIMVRNV